tara:strand:- start:90 stop:338 length:249 start_codon:yes stop_codon:yes gene_type:complete
MKINENVLHQVAARYIAGHPIEMEIKGTDLQLECFKSLLDVSRQLKICLDENKDLEKSLFLVREKKELTRQFQNISGIEWKL